MKIPLLLTLCLAAAGSLLAGRTAFAQSTAQSELMLELLPNEVWWGGAVTLGTQMPYGNQPIEINLDGDNRGNQSAPLLVSSQGRYVWCEKAFKFAFKDRVLQVTSPGSTFSYGHAGQNLRDAYRRASRSFFPSDGKLPDLALFAAPQYNTWIELMYDQNQKDVLKYAHAIVDNGLPPGVLMIDDNWQEDYGKWNFHPGRFPDPKAMMNELHALGFKVMVWVCPFVSLDCDVYRALAKKNAFFMDQPGDPAMVKWWNGKSAMLDLSNPDAKAWFTGELARLQTTCGVDGFKLDAGDTEFYKARYLAHEQLDANEHARLFGEIGLTFPLNEYRACWKLAGHPLVQRLRDKSHNWGDLEKLIPDMTAAGLLGYTFVCPDMIGGGEFSSFLNQATIDQDLIVRSAQVKASAATGEPILRPLAYVFPEGGYENVKDEFMMGDDLLVAPVVTKGSARTVQIPAGKWKADDGTMITGPVQRTFDVPLARLLYFERQ